MSGPSVEELAELGLPTGEKKTRLHRCPGCSEFFFASDDRFCSLCGYDHVLARFVNLASPELLAAMKNVAR